MKIGSLCSGYGGLDLAVLDVFPDARICWFAENNSYASDVLKARFPGIPNHGDITLLAPWGVEPVDMLTAGFPCTDISRAGSREGLLRGNRTGLWHDVARLINDLQPKYVFLENVDAIFTSDSDSMVEPCPWCVGDKSAEPVLSALECVLSDLAEIGYDAEWTTLPASDVGAPHRRERWFCLAFPYSYGTRLERDPRGQRADGVPPEGGFEAA